MRDFETILRQYDYLMETTQPQKEWTKDDDMEELEEAVEELNRVEDRFLDNLSDEEVMVVIAGAGGEEAILSHFLPENQKYAKRVKKKNKRAFYRGLCPAGLAQVSMARGKNN